MTTRIVIIVFVLTAGVISVLLIPSRRTEPRIIWEKAGGEWAPPPAIGNDGTIYFVDSFANLCAVGRDGAFRWRSACPVTTNSVSPTIHAISVAPRSIYCVTSARELAALGTNGSFSWSADVGAPDYSTPTVAPDGGVYVGSKSNRLHAFNPDGSHRWEFKTSGWESGNATVGPDGTIYFQCRKNVYALETNGAVKWTCTNETASLNHPILGPDGTIYIAIFTNFCAIRPDGSIKWRITLYTGQHSAILDRAGALYVCGHDGVSALRAETGELIWKYSEPPAPYCGLALGQDGTIYFSGLNSSIYAIDTDGRFKWQFRRAAHFGAKDAITGVINWFRTRGKRQKMLYASGFVLAEDARLYAIMPDRKLYALEVSAGLDTNAPWPMLKHDVQHSGRAAAMSR